MSKWKPDFRVCMHMCARAWEGQRSTSRVVPQTLSTLLSEAGSLTGLEFPRRGWRAPGICLSLHVMLELKHVPPCLAFSHGFWRSNSGPHDCMAKCFTNWALSPDHGDLTRSPSVWFNIACWHVSLLVKPNFCATEDNACNPYSWSLL